MLTTSYIVPACWKPTDLLSNWNKLQPAWDDFVRDHPKGNIFHTADMVRVFQAAKGHAPLAIAAVNSHGEIAALLVAVRVQTLPDPLGNISSRSILYAEPLCHDDPESVDALTALVEEHDRHMEHTTLFTEVRPIYSPGPERVALERCGYRYLDYLNYVVDVTRPADVLWNKLGRDARRGVRISVRNGFTTHSINTPAGVDVLYRCLLMSYGNAGVPLAHRSLFDSALATLVPKGELKLEAVVRNDTPVAMLATLHYKDLAFAWYCGTKRMRGFSPLDFLFWQEILWSHEQHYGVFDMGGAGWPDEPYGVRRYKSKFGGKLVSFGRYRKVYSQWRMAMAERAYHLGRRLISPR